MLGRDAVMIGEACFGKGYVPSKVEVLSRHRELILYAAAAYNLIGGFALLLIILLHMWESIGSFIGYPYSGPMFLSLFASGAVITFGIGYLQSARGNADARTFLLFGGMLKYWAFLVSLNVYFFDPLFGHTQSTDFILLVLVGGINMAFAVIFTLLLLARSGINGIDSSGP